MKMLKILISLVLTVFSLSPLFAQTEDELDREILSGAGTKEGSGVADREKNVELHGFLESVNQVSIPGTGKRKESDEYGVVKLEGRGRLNARIGSGSYHGIAVLDYYYYPETENESQSAEAYVPPRESGRIEAQELYLRGGDTLQFKLGKQLFSWGSADMFQVTNYFDQPDLREFFAVDKDDKNEGIPALSLKLLIGNFSLEAAATPVHNPALLPPGGSYWELNPDTVEAAGMSLPVTIEEGERLRGGLSNFSCANRIGGTIGDFDFHLSYYNGINPTVILKPELTGTTLANASIEMKPFYERINAFGIDTAFTLGRFSFRGEASYSRKMTAVSEVDTTALQTGLMQIAGAGSTDVEISPSEKVPYLAYTAGADYNLWGNNGLILVEWMDSRYLEHRERYIEPLINGILLVRLEDKFFNESLEAEVGTLLKPEKSKPGHLLTFSLTWNFQNGLSIGAGGYIFQGNDDELMELFEEKDMVYLKAKMEF
jgi:hypothetical protein